MFTPTMFSRRRKDSDCDHPVQRVQAVLPAAQPDLRGLRSAAPREGHIYIYIYMYVYIYIYMYIYI